MKFIRWALLNGAVAAFAYFGFVQGVEGAANVAMVMLWVTIAISPIAISEKISSELREQRYWYKVVDTAYDISMTVFLLWIGFMWTGVFYMIHMLLIAAARFSKKPDSD